MKTAEMRLLIHDYAGHAFQMQLSRELAARGHDVTHAYAANLVTPRGDAGSRSNGSSAVQFVEVPMSAEYKACKYRFVRRRHLEINYGRHLQRLLDRIRPDLVLSGNTPTEPQWMLMRTASRLRIPVIHWLQDFYGPAVASLVRRRSAWLGLAAGLYYTWLEAACLRRAAGVVSISEDFGPLLCQAGVGADAQVVIPNWAALEELPVQPRDNAWSRAQGLHTGFNFLYAGTLALKHDPALLLALAREVSLLPRTRVVVVSEGPGADWLREQSRAASGLPLSLLPYQNHADLPFVIGSGDVLVALLELEAGRFSVPSKVLSYLCAARPVLAAIPENNLAARIILGAPAGLVCSPRDPRAFLNAADRLRSTHELRLSFGRAAREYAEAHFDIRRVADRFLGFFRERLSTLPAHERPCDK